MAFNVELLFLNQAWLIFGTALCSALVSIFIDVLIHNSLDSRDALSHLFLLHQVGYLGDIPLVHLCLHNDTYHCQLPIAKHFKTERLTNYSTIYSTNIFHSLSFSWCKVVFKWMVITIIKWSRNRIKLRQTRIVGRIGAGNIFKWFIFKWKYRNISPEIVA